MIEVRIQCSKCLKDVVTESEIHCIWPHPMNPNWVVCFACVKRYIKLTETK